MYPINLDLDGRLCIVVGGGHVALRKVKGLLREKAEIVVLSPELVPELFQLQAAGQISWRKEEYSSDKSMLLGAFLVFCATNSKEINKQAAEEAKKAGALVNNATAGGQSDFQVPSSVKRGRLQLTVSTSGGSPAFSRLLRMDLERKYNEAFGEWLEIQEELRGELKRKPDIGTKNREGFWRELMDRQGEHLLELIRNGKLEQAEDEVKNAINAFDCLGTKS